MDAARSAIARLSVMRSEPKSDRMRHNYVLQKVEYSFDVSVQHWTASTDQFMVVYGGALHVASDNATGDSFAVASDISRSPKTPFHILCIYSVPRDAAFVNCKLKIDGESLEINDKIGPSTQWLNVAEWQELPAQKNKNGLLRVKFTATKVFPKPDPSGFGINDLNELKIVPRNFTILFDGELFARNDDTDFSLHCKGVEFFCHKVVLSKRSSVFERMVNGDAAEASSGSADLSPHTRESVEMLLSVIYGKTRIDEVAKGQPLLDLYILLHLYRVEPEQTICAKYIAALMPVDRDNVGTLTKMAFLYDMPELKRKCAEALLQMPKSTLRSSSWRKLFGNQQTSELYKELFEALMAEDKPGRDGANR